jgi:hypothetical protein
LDPDTDRDTDETKSPRNADKKMNGMTRNYQYSYPFDLLGRFAIPLKHDIVLLFWH